MKKHPGKTRQAVKPSGELFTLIFLFACFAFAGIFGCFAVVNAGEHSGASLLLYLDRYVSLLAEGTSTVPSFFSVFCDFFIWPLVLFLLGLTTLGILVVPLIFALRAFLLSYAVSAFFQVFGVSGGGAALAIFGLNAFVQVPVLFAVGTSAFLSSLRLAQGTLGGCTSRLSLLEYFSVLPPCAAILFPAVFLQWSVMPPLLQAAARFLSLE